MSDLPPPLILTLQLDAVSFATLNALRQRHFPPERNFIAAHVTLFHALPGDQEEAIRGALHAVCMETPPLHLSFPGIRTLGRGVAIDVAGDELAALRMQLARRFHHWLTPQDRQGWRPHVTIQNKVAPAEARALHETLSARWTPLAGAGEGLLLWHYLGGPWKEAGAFAFTGR